MRKPPINVEELPVRVRFVAASSTHDWKSLGEVLEQIGRPFVPHTALIAQQPEEAIPCPS